MTAPLFIPRAIHAGKGAVLPSRTDAESLFVDRSPCIFELVSAGAETRTLQRPTSEGDIVTLICQTYVGNITLTVTGGYNINGDTTFTFSAAKQWIMLQSAYDVTNAVYYWVEIANYANSNLSPTELAWLDGITAGTAAASKAMVTNSSNQIGSLAALAIGAAIPTNPQSLLAVIPGANASGVTANQSYYHAEVAPSGAVTIPTGTAPVVASLLVAEPNITATGTVTNATSLYVSGAPTEGGTGNYAAWIAGLTRIDGNLNFANAAASIIGKANTAAALSITDGTTSLLVADTRNTVSVVTFEIQGPASQTLPDGATARSRTMDFAAKTVTLAGTTQVTTENLGVQLCINAPTINQSGGAVTVDRASTLHVGTTVAGASVTITANHIVSTDTSGCFCTAAGIWTDTPCWEYSKQQVDRAYDHAVQAVSAVLEMLTPATWKYREEFQVDDGHGKVTPIKMNDRGRERVGIVYDDLPEALRAPGEKSAVSGSLLASFALAAVKMLYEQNRDLLGRVAALEARP